MKNEQHLLNPDGYVKDSVFNMALKTASHKIDWFNERSAKGQLSEAQIQKVSDALSDMRQESWEERLNAKTSENSTQKTQR